MESTPFEAAASEFGSKLRFEARALFGGFEIVQGVLRDLVAGFGISSQNFPVVFLFFHFVLFAFDFLRFKAKLFFATLGTEFEQVSERLVEGAGVSGFATEVEGEHFGVGDLTGGEVEAGVLEALGALAEPVGFGHGVDQDGFRDGRGLVFIEQSLLERFEAKGIFGG